MNSPSLKTNARDVGVWIQPLPEDGAWESEARTVLPADEWRRAECFRFHEDRIRFVLGRLMLRRLASRRLGIPPSDVPVVQDAFGKPAIAFLAGGFEFNLAHSGSLVALAWSENLPVGIDVEIMAPRSNGDFLELAAQVCSSEELQVLAKMAGSNLAETFYRFWSRKESVLKAEGCGLGGEAKACQVATLRGRHLDWKEEVTYPPSGRRWQVRNLPIAAGYAGALAFPQSGHPRLAQEAPPR